MNLTELKIGESSIILEVKGTGALRRRLLEMGLTPKTKVTLMKVAPLGDPVEILIRGYSLSLRKEDAKNIEIEGSSL